MSCLNPILITNPKKCIDLNSNEKIQLYVPCNCCQGCLNDKNNEYALRAYYEFFECTKNKGYALFDTLTYSERNVPRLKYYLDNLELGKHANDYCFDEDDLRYFFVRLRRRLSYEGYTKDVFRYFYSTEYGKKRTKRPHIHILLFVKKELDPIKLSKLIDQSWQLGRTDGVNYRGKKYVLNHCVFNNRNSMEHIYNTTNYVTKYVMKDIETRAIHHKYVMQLLYPLTKTLKYNELNTEQRKTYRYIFNLKANTHKHSQGFGKYMLECIPEDYIRKTGMVYYMHKRSTYQMKLPMYYFRKLYTWRIKNNLGESYILNEAGKEFLRNKIKNNILYTYKKYKELRAQNKVQTDPKLLTYYNIYENGRIQKTEKTTVEKLLPTNTITAQLSTNKMYNYTKRKDHEEFGFNFYSDTYITSSGEIVHANIVDKKTFIQNHCTSNLPDNVHRTIISEMLGLYNDNREKAKRKRQEFLKIKHLKEQLQHDYNY